MPSDAFAHPETTSVGALFQKAADNTGGYRVSPCFEKVPRLAMANLAEKDAAAYHAGRPAPWLP